MNALRASAGSAARALWVIASAIALTPHAVASSDAALPAWRPGAYEALQAVLAQADAVALPACLPDTPEVPGSLLLPPAFDSPLPDCEGILDFTRIWPAGCAQFTAQMFVHNPRSGRTLVGACGGGDVGRLEPDRIALNFQGPSFGGQDPTVAFELLTPVADPPAACGASVLMRVASPAAFSEWRGVGDIRQDGPQTLVWGRMDHHQDDGARYWMDWRLRVTGRDLYFYIYGNGAQGSVRFLRLACPPAD